MPLGSSISSPSERGIYARKMSRKINIEWKKLFNLQKAKEESNRRIVFNAPFSAHELELALRRLKIFQQTFFPLFVLLSCQKFFFCRLLNNFVDLNNSSFH